MGQKFVWEKRSDPAAVLEGSVVGEAPDLANGCCRDHCRKAAPSASSSQRQPNRELAAIGMPTGGTQDRAAMATVDGRCWITHLHSVLMVSVFSYLTYECKSLERYAVLCRSFWEHLNEDAVWQHLCKDFWFVTEERFKQWPAMRTYRALYRALEQWAVLEGFYSMPTAFPWSLLVLLRFETGTLVAEAIRFCDDGGRRQEVRTRLFEVTLLEEAGHVCAALRFPLDKNGILGSTFAFVGPLPQTVRATLASARGFRHKDEVVPRWISPAHGVSVELLPSGPKCGLMCNETSTPNCVGDCGDGGSSSDEFLSSDGVETEVAGGMEFWDASHAISRDNLEDMTARMVLLMLRSVRSLPLVLVRSPMDYTLDDPSAPHLHPGLYVGNYGHGQYGQFTHEVILVEYRECNAKNIVSLFTFDDRKAVPRRLQEVLDSAVHGETLSFLVGTKVTGDVHVPAGQATFVALCSPQPLVERLCHSNGGQVQTVMNYSSREVEVVKRSWPGFGIIAGIGFHSPSWSPGNLVQLEARSGDLSGETCRADRFGFMWRRDRDVIVLEYVKAQAAAPFLGRKWLPEALR